MPFFDDSYAVDSANVGPYGTAILTELLPAIEHRYRGIGEGWARGVLGGSTGGWEAFASQVLYPDAFNGAAVACPDPIGFSSFTTINLYEVRTAGWKHSMTARSRQALCPRRRGHSHLPLPLLPQPRPLLSLRPSARLTQPEYLSAYSLTY